MKCRTALLFLMLLVPGVALAQQQAPQTPEQREKQMYENIQKQVDNMAESLDLEDWQIFYVDSILVHDYKAMQAELTDLQKQKVSNTNMYYDVQYKWMDKIYDAYGKLFDEDQWAKYLKSGAAREKKTRDKFREKQKR